MIKESNYLLFVKTCWEEIKKKHTDKWRLLKSFISDHDKIIIIKLYSKYLRYYISTIFRNYINHTIDCIKLEKYALTVPFHATLPSGGSDNLIFHETTLTRSKEFIISEFNLVFSDSIFIEKKKTRSN